jgi:hypothetical protein
MKIVLDLSAVRVCKGMDHLMEVILTGCLLAARAYHS